MQVRQRWVVQHQDLVCGPIGFYSAFMDALSDSQAG
jgi:hypothetical protein